MSKAIPGWPPRWLTPTPAAALRKSRGPETSDFINTFCRVTKDSIGGRSGDLVVMRGWQNELVRHVLAERPDRRLLYRQALIGVARKNGKSALGAGIALDHLLFGGPGSEVYSCAGDREQARIVFGTAKRMVELEPELSGRLKCYRDAIEHTEAGSVYKVLSAEAYSKEGLNPTLVLFDEVHVQPNRELWDVMAQAMGSRIEPLMIGITTAGVRFDTSGQDSLCYSMYQFGKRIVSGEIDDPSFFFAWWEPANPDADHRDPKTWAEASPGLGDIVSLEDYAAMVLKTPEAEFRTKRCNQFVAAATAWLPAGAWENCGEESIAIPDGAEVCLGFDGSFNNDSTALVVVSCGEIPHIDVVECWERPTEAAQDWAVPITAVEDAIRAACKRWQVREIVCDPFRWARTYQVLEDEGLPIVEYPQSPSRMTPATQRFYEAVMNKGLTHSKDQRLARHIGNAVMKQDSRGTRIVKEAKNSARKIDLAVAAVMAFDRAATTPESIVVPRIHEWPNDDEIAEWEREDSLT